MDSFQKNVSVRCGEFFAKPLQKETWLEAMNRKNPLIVEVSFLRDKQNSWKELMKRGRPGFCK